MQSKKQAYCGIIIFLICIVMAGCNKEEKERTKLFQRVMVEDFNSVRQEFDTCEMAKTVCRDGQAYLLLEGYSGMQRLRVLYRISEDELEEITHSDRQQDSTTIAYDIGADGKIYLLEERYDETNDIEEKYIQVLEKDGQQQEMQIQMDESLTVTSMLLGKDDTIYLFLEDGKIYIVDQSGNITSQIAAHEGEIILDTARSVEGQVVFAAVRYSGDKERLKLYRIIEDGNKTECIAELNAQDYNEDMLINGAGSYSVYLRSNEYVSGFSLETDKETPLMSWKENDFVSDEIGEIAALSEERWIAIEWSETDRLVYMQQGEAQEQKVELQLLCLKADSVLQKQIADFNRSSLDYHIKVISYEEYENPNKAFLMDLAVGKTGDIVVLPETNQESFLKKGFLVDLYPFMEKDLDFCKEDFLPNVLKAYEQDGRLYHTVSWVNINGWIIRKSNMENPDGWDWETVQKLLEQYPDAAMFADTSCEEILQELMKGMLDSFVDWQQGTCNFQSEEFYDILDTAKTYGEKTADIPPEEEIQALLDGKLLFSKMTVNPFEIELFSEALKDDFAFMGPYVGSRNGGVFWSSDIQCGILKNSKQMDGAWQFVRTYFTKEHQDLNQDIISFGMSPDGIPVRKDCFEEFVKRYSATEGYDKDGAWIEPLEGTCGTNRFDYTIAPLSEFQEKLFREIVTGTVQKEKTDEQMKQIILEESEAYFNNEKEKEQVAEIIQDRVSTYLKE